MSVYIFDLDGTLADSNTAWERIDRELIKRHHADIPEEIAASLAAMSYEQLYDTLESFGIKYADVDALRRELDALAEHEYAVNIKLREGAAGFVRQVSLRYRTVLFTDSPERLYRPLLERYGIYDCFSELVCAGDIGADKKTDGYKKLSSVIGIAPGDCVVFEDNPLCAQSAKSAGMRVVCVYDEFSSRLLGYDSMNDIAERTIFGFDTECEMI